MGKIPQGILGRLSASVGGVTGASVFGRPTLRSKSSGGVNPRTPAQVENRNKLAEASEYCRKKWSRILEAGLFSERRGVTLWQQAVGWRLAGGVLPWYSPSWDGDKSGYNPQLELHYARIVQVGTRLGLGGNVRDAFGPNAYISSFAISSSNILAPDGGEFRLYYNFDTEGNFIVRPLFNNQSLQWLACYPSGRVVLWIGVKGADDGVEEKNVVLTLYTAEFEEDVITSRSLSRDAALALLSDVGRVEKVDGVDCFVIDADFFDNRFGNNASIDLSSLGIFNGATGGSVVNEYVCEEFADPGWGVNFSCGVSGSSLLVTGGPYISDLTAALIAGVKGVKVSGALYLGQFYVDESSLFFVRNPFFTGIDPGEDSVVGRFKLWAPELLIGEEEEIGSNVYYWMKVGKVRVDGSDLVVTLGASVAAPFVMAFSSQVFYSFWYEGATRTISGSVSYGVADGKMFFRIANFSVYGSAVLVSEGGVIVMRACFKLNGRYDFAPVPLIFNVTPEV